MEQFRKGQLYMNTLTYFGIWRLIPHAPTVWKV